MLDMAVLLSIDVALTMLFCVHHVDLKTSEHVSRRKWVFFIFLKYFRVCWFSQCCSVFW